MVKLTNEVSECMNRMRFLFFVSLNRLTCPANSLHILLQMFMTGSHKICKPASVIFLDARVIMVILKYLQWYTTFKWYGFLENCGANIILEYTQVEFPTV